MSLAVTPANQRGDMLVIETILRHGKCPPKISKPHDLGTQSVWKTRGYSVAAEVGQALLDEFALQFIEQFAVRDDVIRSQAEHDRVVRIFD
ncbi:hypothetical protein D9M70_537720 [compost metagenome]